MEFNSAFDELCSIEEEEEGSSRGNLGMNKANGGKVFKSKNLQAERKRRQKLKERLLSLRALIPFITKMNKATILEDAITYITKLQSHVKELSDQLLEMELLSKEEAKLKNTDEVDCKEEMKKSGIEADVQVTSIDGKKLWIRIVLEKKRGGLTRLMEAMNFLGLELTDTSVTTSKGAILVSSCAEVIYGGRPAIEQIRELLLEIIRSL